MFYRTMSARETWSVYGSTQSLIIRKRGRGEGNIGDGVGAGIDGI
jgi:hypothetical protein